jgi:hypothetical protein
MFRLRLKKGDKFGVRVELRDRRPLLQFPLLQFPLLQFPLLPFLRPLPLLKIILQLRSLEKSLPPKASVD